MQLDPLDFWARAIYACGFNSVPRGFTTFGTRFAVTAVGDALTPLSAVPGVFTLSYDSTIAAQCGLGIAVKFDCRIWIRDSKAEVPLGDLPTKFFASLPHTDVTACLRMLRDEGLPVGKLRPEDKEDDLLKPPPTRNPLRWLFGRSAYEDVLSELHYQLSRQLERSWSEEARCAKDNYAWRLRAHLVWGDGLV